MEVCSWENHLFRLGPSKKPWRTVSHNLRVNIFKKNKKQFLVISHGATQAVVSTGWNWPKFAAHIGKPMWTSERKLVWKWKKKQNKPKASSKQMETTHHLKLPADLDNITQALISQDSCSDVARTHDRWSSCNPYANSNWRRLKLFTSTGPSGTVIDSCIIKAAKIWKAKK